MRRILDGLVVLLPLVLIGALAEKLFVTLRGIVHPVLDAFPGTILREPALRFVMERHANGRLTVFLPASPATAGGTVLCVDGALVRELPVAGHRVLQCLSAWGHGASALVKEKETTA